MNKLLASLAFVLCLSGCSNETYHVWINDNAYDVSSPSDLSYVLQNLNERVKQSDCLIKKVDREYYKETFGEYPSTETGSDCVDGNPYATKQNVLGDGEVWLVKKCGKDGYMCEQIICKTLPCK